MSTPPNDRQKIIDTWEDLDEAIGDWERGRLDEHDLRSAWKDYLEACKESKEPAFWLKDIVNDDMLYIPDGYPSSGPAELPQRGGIYLTKTYEAYDNARAARSRVMLKGRRE